MHPLQVAAEFAAFVWFTDSDPEKQPDQDEALRFAHQNWTTFVPAVHEGLGRLLLRIARTRTPAPRARQDRFGGRKTASGRTLATVG